MADRGNGTEHGAGLITARRQQRIREQLRDAVDQAKALDAGMERDKRRSSIRQFLAIDEVDALLDYIEGLERDNTHAYTAYPPVTEPGGLLLGALYRWACGLRGHRVEYDCGGSYHGCHCGRPS